MNAAFATALAAALYAAAFPPLGAAWLGWVALVPLALALRSAGAAAAAARAALFGGLATLVVIAWLVPTLTGHCERPMLFAAAFWLALGAASAAPFLAVASRAPRGRGPRWRLRSVRRSSRSPGSRPSSRARSSGCARRGHSSATRTPARRGCARSPTSAASTAWASSRSGMRRSPSSRPRSRCAPLIRARAARARRGAGLRRVVAARARLRRAGSAASRTRSRGLRVAIVQANEPPELRWRSARRARVLARYAHLTERARARAAARARGLARERAPDRAARSAPGARDRRDSPGARRSSSARRAARSAAPRGYLNSAWLLRRTARRVLRQAPAAAVRRDAPARARRSSGSRRPRPGSFAAGAAPGLFRSGATCSGALICMEALYPADARALARRGATVLVNLSNDGWYRGRGGAEQHSRASCFRAVETRLPLVRSTTTGISAIVDASGASSRSCRPGPRACSPHAVPRGAGRVALRAHRRPFAGVRRALARRAACARCEVVTALPLGVITARPPARAGRRADLPASCTSGRSADAAATRARRGAPEARKPLLTRVSRRHAACSISAPSTASVSPRLRRSPVVLVLALALPSSRALRRARGLRLREAAAAARSVRRP